METLGIYLLKMLICSAVLYGYYRAALFNERFHQWNRFYLLAAMVLSVVVPFVNIPLYTEQPVVVTAVSAMPWNMGIIVRPVERSFSWQEIAAATGLAISLVLVIRILVTVAKLLTAYRQNPVSRMDEKVQLIVTELNNAPFSFFNWLFWRQDIDPESANGQRMLAHELTHIRERHSFDKLFTELLLCVFWMNPFFWLMRKELDMIHEFLADRKAIGRQDGKAFAEMILQAIHVQPQYAMANPFFSSQIKRRLLMITTSKTPQYTYLRRISGLVVMIGSAIVLTLTVQQVEAQNQAKSLEYKGKPMKEINVDYTSGEIKIKLTNDSTISTTIKRSLDDKSLPLSILTQSKAAEISKDSMQQLIAVEKAKLKKISSLPESARDGYLVTITTDGQKMVYGTDSGRSSLFNDYVLDDTNSPFNATTTTFKTIYAGNSPIKPLFIYDGNEVDGAEIENLTKQKQVYRIETWRGMAATEKFGEKGGNGVVVIIPESSSKFKQAEEFKGPNSLKIEIGEIKKVSPSKPQP